MSTPVLPLQFGIPGGPELLVIVLIAVLLFGANKIPKLARSTGEAMGEFQKGREEVEQELQEIRDGPGKTDSGSNDELESGSMDDTASANETGTEADRAGSDDETGTDTESDFEIEDAEANKSEETN